MLLPRHSQALYLLQRIRDEAHRFGITAHRKRRTKLGLASQLEAVPGIGPERRKLLLKHFGSMDKIPGSRPAWRNWRPCCRRMQRRPSYQCSGQ